MAGRGKDTKTRIALQQAIYIKGYKSCADFARACDAYCRQRGIDLTFGDTSIINYINCHCEMTFKRMRIISRLLKIDYEEMDEKFTPPAVRGCGDWWIGDNGSRARDSDYSITRNY